MSAIGRVEKSFGAWCDVTATVKHDVTNLIAQIGSTRLAGQQNRAILPLEPPRQ
jgi:hypothetical protein